MLVTTEVTNVLSCLPSYETTHIDGITFSTGGAIHSEAGQGRDIKHWMELVTEHLQTYNKDRVKHRMELVTQHLQTYSKGKSNTGWNW